MKRHVAMETHKSALTHAQIWTLSTNMQPPLPLPCPTPWAETLEPAYSSSCLNVLHTSSRSESESNSSSSSSSSSDSKVSASSVNAHAHQCRMRSGKGINHVLSAVNDIDLEKDSNLDEIGAETEEGFLASILNKDILRGFN
ncbi:hypothetical protein FRC11_003225, partial [Ceratobasidium sp. 423]